MGLIWHSGPARPLHPCIARVSPCGSTLSCGVLESEQNQPEVDASGHRHLRDKTNLPSASTLWAIRTMVRRNCVLTLLGHARDVRGCDTRRRGGCYETDAYRADRCRCISRFCVVWDGTYSIEGSSGGPRGR